MARMSDSLADRCERALVGAAEHLRLYHADGDDFLEAENELRQLAAEVNLSRAMI